MTIHRYCRPGEPCIHPTCPPCSAGGLDDPEEVSSSFEVVFMPTGRVISRHATRREASIAMDDAPFGCLVQRAKDV